MVRDQWWERVEGQRPGYMRDVSLKVATLHRDGDRIDEMGVYWGSQYCGDTGYNAGTQHNAVGTQEDDRDEMGTLETQY